VAILGNGGLTTKGDSSIGLAAGRTFVTPATLASGSTLTELHGWFNGTGTNVRIVIYADTGSLPGALVAYTNPLALTGAGDVELSQTGMSVVLAAGTYWLGFVSEGAGTGSTNFFYNSTGGSYQGKASGHTFTPPNDPFGTPTNSDPNRRVSCWAIVGPPSTSRSAVVAATGTVTAVGARVRQAAVALTATGTVTVAGVVDTFVTATAAISATADIGVAGGVPGTSVPPVALWTFTLADISTGTELCELTGAVLSAKIAPRLNRPLTVTLELPADNPDIRATAADGDPNLTVGTRSIKAHRNGVLRANVIVWNLSYDGDANEAKVSVTGYDPLVQLRRRPARDATGDFSNPEFGDETPAGELVKYIVDTTITWEGELLIDTEEGTCDASTALGGNLGGWPIMIFDLFSIITDTGVVDVVLEPTEDIPDKLAVLNAVDTWGEDRTASVSFDYATGDHNVASARRVVDFDEICNKL
jgi:hypothetical protein